MNRIDLEFLSWGLAMMMLACLFSSIFTSLCFTGNAGLLRLIERQQGRSVKLLTYWENRWNLLCKTSHMLFTLAEIAAFVLLYQSLCNSSILLMAGGFLLLSLVHMLAAGIVPHVLSESYADRISLAALPAIGVLTLLLYPFVQPLQFIENRLLRQAMSASDEKDRPSTEDEIISLMEESGEEKGHEIIRSVFEFGETVAREIMIPRIDIAAIKESLTVAECIEQVKESRHSRFPVYRENIDDVIGMVHVKELLKQMSRQGEGAVSQLARKIEFVPESMPLSNLLQLMKQTRSQMVLVVDEYGGTEGLVTMEDVIEELVGEIEDEYDLKEGELHRFSDGSVIAQARISVHELNEALQSAIPESEEYDSLGGYIFSELGRIPRTGEKLSISGYTLRIRTATNRRIQVVQILPEAQGPQ